MPENSTHMNAIDLRFTVDRIARLKQHIAIAKDLGRAYDDELEELSALSARLDAHPIRSYVQTYTAIRITRFDLSLRDRNIDYWCVVQCEGRAHKAFDKPSSLMLWMEERGLTLSEPLPFEGPVLTQPVIGSYREASHCSYDVFNSLAGNRTRAMSNGSYTMGIITFDDDGLRTVHTLNPNCSDRPVYEYAESSVLYR